ncbi:MAG: DMT family transporter [Gammaproteobacteria bacterium]|nr:DMT family transporter [Gammaproteobacteria bacterium]
MEKPDRYFVTTYLLFAALILVWALSWPISKIGLAYMPSFWYTLARTLLGCIIVFTVLYCKKKLCLPKRQDLPIILSIGILELGIALPLIALGLSYVDTARSALLLYTSPFWATPIAYFLFKEKISSIKLIGLIFGLFGFVLLFKPASFNWTDKNVLIGNGCIISAAILWTIVILHTRFGKWISQPLELLPWQLLLGSFITLIFALIIEPHPSVIWNTALISSLLYNAIFACAFGYFASITVTRRLPVVSTSIGFLGVPVIGIALSTIVFHGSLTQSFIFASIFILLGLVIISVEPKFTVNKVDFQ